MRVPIEHLHQDLLFSVFTIAILVDVVVSHCGFDLHFPEDYTLAAF